MQTKQLLNLSLHFLEKKNQCIELMRVSTLKCGDFGLQLSKSGAQ